jgi:hypothetical protein
MGGGELDRPNRSAGTDSAGTQSTGAEARGDAAGLDRRTFIRRAGQTGVAAGAIVWSTPRIRSVGAQAAAGSPPPSNTTPTVLGEPITPGGGSTGPIVQGVQAEPPGSSLALTGAELGHLAALGGAAVGMGEVIRRKGQSRKRAIEAEAELYGPPAPTEPTAPA